MNRFGKKRVGILFFALALVLEALVSGAWAAPCKRALTRNAHEQAVHDSLKAIETRFAQTRFGEDRGALLTEVLKIAHTCSDSPQLDLWQIHRYACAERVAETLYLFSDDVWSPIVQEQLSDFFKTRSMVFYFYRSWVSRLMGYAPSIEVLESARRNPNLEDRRHLEAARQESLVARMIREAKGLSTADDSKLEVLKRMKSRRAPIAVLLEKAGWDFESLETYPSRPAIFAAVRSLLPKDLSIEFVDIYLDPKGRMRELPFGHTPPAGWYLERGLLDASQYLDLIRRGKYPVGGFRLESVPGERITTFEHDLGHIASLAVYPEYYRSLQKALKRNPKWTWKGSQGSLRNRRQQLALESLIALDPQKTEQLKSALFMPSDWDVDDLSRDQYSLHAFLKMQESDPLRVKAKAFVSALETALVPFGGSAGDAFTSLNWELEIPTTNDFRFEFLIPLRRLKLALESDAPLEKWLKWYAELQNLVRIHLAIPIDVFISDLLSDDEFPAFCEKLLQQPQGHPYAPVCMAFGNDFKAKLKAPRKPRAPR